MTMLHNCGTPVIVDLNKSFSFYGFPNQDGDVLRITTMFIKTDNIIPVYYCQDCREIVEEDELRVKCENCNELLPIKFAKTSHYDNILCESCVKECGVDEAKDAVFPRYRKDNE